MKSVLKLAIHIFLMMAFTTPVEGVFAKVKKAAVTKKALPGAQNSQLGTSFSFEAASVRGKYQTAGQGVATVEDEKVLDDLLGLRKQFKDREQQEASRR